MFPEQPTLCPYTGSIADQVTQALMDAICGNHVTVPNVDEFIFRQAAHMIISNSLTAGDNYHFSRIFGRSNLTLKNFMEDLSLSECILPDHFFLNITPARVTIDANNKRTYTLDLL